MTKDDMNGLDLAFFGQPFVVEGRTAITSTGLDLAFFAEPFFIQTNIDTVGVVVYNATRMFLMF